MVDRNINIISTNVCGVNGLKKRGAILSSLLSFNAYTIHFLQETKLSSQPSETEWPYHSYFTFNVGASACGVAFLFNQNIYPSRIVDPHDNRTLLCTIDDVDFINVYAPATNSNDRRVYFESLFDFIRLNHNPKFSLVLGGDFNVRNLDKINHQDVQALNDIIDAFGLQLVKDPSVTFTRESQGIYSLLDLFLVSFNNNSGNKNHYNTKLEKVLKISDHYSINLNVDFVHVPKVSFGSNTTTNKASFWKLNKELLFQSNPNNSTSTTTTTTTTTTILQDNLNDKVLDPHLVSLIDDLLNRGKSLKSPSDIFKFWDIQFKPSIKRFLIDKGSSQNNFSSFKIRNEIVKISKDIEVILKKLQVFDPNKILYYFNPSNVVVDNVLDNDDPINVDELRHELYVKEELLRIANDKLLKGCFIRCNNRLNLSLHKETPTKMFFSLEAHHKKTNTIKGLKTLDGKVIKDSKEIVDCLKDFYQNLFSSSSLSSFKDHSIHPFSQFLPMPLHDDDFDLLNAPFSLEELDVVFNQLRKDSSPGPDGITYNFYILLKQKLAPFLLLLFNHILSSADCPYSFKDSLIKLIPKKKNEDILECKDFRPISLTNCDFKIFSKLITNRLKSLSDTLIDPSQTGLPNRSIFHNIIFAHANMFNQDAQIFIDFEKAYDKVNRDYIVALMEHLNFGPLSNVIKNVLFYNTSSRLVCNQVVSERFTTLNGLRQGDPSSPWLFCLALDPLVRYLKSKLSLNIAAYLDDLNIILPNFDDIVKVNPILDRFTLVSGLQVNSSKCSIIPMRTLPISLKFPYAIRLYSNYLGSPFFSPIISRTVRDKVIEDFWKEKLDKSIHILKIWSKHHLSLKGKVTIWNSLIMSRFLHGGFVSQIPSSILESLDKELRIFLWEGNNPALALEKLCLPCSHGGLNLINILDQIDTLRIAFFKANINGSILSSLIFKNKVSPNPRDLIKWASQSFGSSSLRIRNPTNMLNSSSSIPPFFSSLLNSISKLEGIATQWPDSNKECRNLLVQRRMKKGGIILENYYANIINEKGLLLSMLRVWKPDAPAKWNEVFFKFLHRALPLQDRLHRFFNETCPFCKKRLMLDHAHLFLDCSDTTSALALALSALNYHPRDIKSFILKGFHPDPRIMLAHRKWFHTIWTQYVSSLNDKQSRLSLNQLLSSFVSSLKN